MRRLEPLDRPAHWVTLAAVALVIDNICGWVATSTKFWGAEAGTFARVVAVTVAGISALIGVAMMFAIPILFLRWLLLAARRASAIGVALPASPGWIVGWWLIPVANLMMGFRLLNRLSGALAGHELVGNLLWPWSFAFVASFVLAGVEVAMGWSGHPPPWFYVAGSALWLFASVCTFVAMRRIQGALDLAESARAGD